MNPLKLIRTKFLNIRVEICIYGELPTHAKAMGWASGFNGRAT